jgi:hypothetical protein
MDVEWSAVVELEHPWYQGVTLYTITSDAAQNSKSYQRARESYELAAHQGNAAAQFDLGLTYEYSEGVDQNYERAKEYYEAAARQGYADAQPNLGLFYAKGQGVKQSFEIAREWWMKSAEQGLVMAIKCLQDLDEHERRITPSFIPKPFECAACYMYHPHDPPEHKLRPCKRCHRVYYCGKKVK